MPAAFVEMMAEAGFPVTLYLSIKWWEVLITVLFAVLTALFAALGPARMAAAIEPAEAMRYTA